MLPIGDDNPTFRTPIVTIGLIVTMLAVWMWQWYPGDVQLATTVCRYGLVPAELTHLREVGYGIPIGAGLGCFIDHDWINWATPLSSMFLHGSWGHVLANALFLWVFGNNVEDVMGRKRFLVFYLLCGFIAAGTQVIVNPSSPVPTVGASGAISGALGAYLLLYPSVSVRMYFPPIFFFRLPAWFVLLMWFAVQFATGLPQLLNPSPAISGGVAVWAHIGGFVAGALLSKAFEDPELVAMHRAALPPRRR